MRDIKFRAWDKQNKRMIAIERFGQIPNNWRECWDLMQYTGLKDKNGREIYEGDILRVAEGALPDVAVVKFMVDGDWPGFYLESTHWKSSFPSERDVIGNIYENPELVK